MYLPFNSPLWASVSPSKNGIKIHFIYFCLTRAVPRAGQNQALTNICCLACSGLPWFYHGCNWDPRLVLRGGNSGGAGSRSWAQFPELTAASSGGGTQLAPRPHPLASRRLILTEIEDGSGSPLVGSPGPVHPATASTFTPRIYQQPGKTDLQL